MVALGMGAVADLSCFRCLARHNRILERYEIPRATTYPLKARARFGDGRRGEVRRAADMPVGIAGNGDKFTAFELDADIPAFLRKGAMGALGGQLDFCAVRWFNADRE